MMKQFLHFSILCLFSIPVVFADSEAEKLLQDRMNTPIFKTQGTMTGEGPCWHAAYDMDRFMDKYRETSDPAFLDAAVKYYDALIEKMHTSPDGYKGWVGPYIYDEKYICDVHIGDAILINPMLEFAEIVLKQSSADITTKYSESAKKYIGLAKKHLIEKWEKRGTWHEDGPYGGFVSWDRYLTPDNLKEWKVIPVLKSTLSLPFNKQNAMGLAYLRLYRITGENAYREKALKIFNFMKSRMCLYNDHYVWNYWEPLGVWDIDPEKPNTLCHWVNVHPYRNYQAEEINQIAEAYHSGITFTKDDIQHIINTNLKVMWNGDKEHPAWKNSNYAAEVASIGKPSIEKAPGGEFPELAGTLWRGLADFDPTIRALAKIQDKTPPSFERKYKSLPVTEFSVPFSNNCYFNMVTVLPSISTKDKPAYLISQNRVSGLVTIDLYSNDGKNKICNIHEGKKDSNEELQILQWDRKDTAPGNYRVRWTFKDQCREFPVTIK